MSQTKQASSKPDYRETPCPNCGRLRLKMSGICEKCYWDADGSAYVSITGRCPFSLDGNHEFVPANAVLGKPFNECRYCQKEEVKS